MTVFNFVCTGSFSLTINKLLHYQFILYYKTPWLNLQNVTLVILLQIKKQFYNFRANTPKTMKSDAGRTSWSCASRSSSSYRGFPSTSSTSSWTSTRPWWSRSSPATRLSSTRCFTSSGSATRSQTPSCTATSTRTLEKNTKAFTGRTNTYY